MDLKGHWPMSQIEIVCKKTAGHDHNFQQALDGLSEAFGAERASVSHTNMVIPEIYL